jgi:hypothetical protein
MGEGARRACERSSGHGRLGRDGPPSICPRPCPCPSEVHDKDVLIVVSKMKKYVKDRSGMNCSDQIVDLLSDHVRALCDDAIRAAARDDRKTVLERDIARPRR